MNCVVEEELSELEGQGGDSVLTYHVRHRIPVWAVVQCRDGLLKSIVLINYNAALIYFSQLVLVAGGLFAMLTSWAMLEAAVPDVIDIGISLMIISPFAVATVISCLLLVRTRRGAMEIIFEAGAFGPVRVIHEHPRTRLDARECVVCMQIADEWVVLVRGVGLKRVNRLLATLRDAGVDNITETTIIRSGPFRKGAFGAMLRWGIFHRRRLRVRADGSVDWLDGGPR
jgi:hypothetical protein